MQVSKSLLGDSIGDGRQDGRTTCRDEVAVSVRTPPQHPRAANEGPAAAALAESTDAAGRDRREIERANTIMNDVGDERVAVGDVNSQCPTKSKLELWITGCW